MAIIYTYPNLPLSSLSADDLLVITDIDNTNNNPTKSVKLSDIATYITNTGTGTGTTNTLTLWSDGPSGVLGDSILTQNVGATALTVTGNFIATGTGNFTSQVTIPATPGINTDAASKGYVDTQVAGIPAGLVFKGNWDASSTPGGSPDLTSAIYKVVGNYYVVSTAGAATPNGAGTLPNSWDVGDWCVYIEQGGTDRWEKLDQTFIAGSGATGQAAFFTTVNSVGGDNNFFWDNTNKRLGIGTDNPDSTLEVQNTPAQDTQTMMLHLDNNPVNNQGSGYLQISSGTNTQATLQIEQVSSGGSGIFGNNYLDSTFINRALSANAYGNINFATGSNASAVSIVMTIGGGSQKGNVGIGTTSPDRALEIENSNGIGSMVLTGTTGSTLYFRPTASYSPGGNFGILVTGGSGPEFLSTMKFSGYHTSSGGVNTIMTLKGDGNVGIGTTLPQSKLHVVGDARVYDSGGEYIQLNPTSGNQQIITSSGGINLTPANGSIRVTKSGQNSEIKIDNSSQTNAVVFKSSGNSYLNGGNLGIGTTSPVAILDVRKNQAGYTYIASDNANTAAPGTGSGFVMTEGGSVAWYLRNERDGSGKFNIGNSANRLTIDSSGNTTFAGKVNVAGSTNNESSLNVLTQSGSIGSIGFETGSEVTGIISSNTELMEFRVGDGVGISSAKQLKIDTGGIEVTGDIDVTNSSDGLILKSPDGTRYRVTVANGGTLSVSAV